MINKHRTYRDIYSSTTIALLILCVSFQLIFILIYLLFSIKLFLKLFVSLLFVETSVLVGVLSVFYIMHQANQGVLYSIKHAQVERKIRLYFLDAGFYVLRNTVFGEIAELPKILISFEEKLAFGKIQVKNNVKFDKKFEDLRLSSALDKYVVEIQYISLDQNWYIYEFYDSNLINQKQFSSYKEFQEYNKKINSYELFIDDYSSFPIHHALIVGQTGSGKTYALLSFILQLLNKDIKVSIYFADTKSAGVKVIGNSIAPERTASEIDSIIILLETFCEDMEKTKLKVESRLMENIDYDYKDFNMCPKIFIFDEFADFKLITQTYDKKARDHIQSLLSRITLQGRQVGYFLWISMQKSDSTLLPTFIRENLPIKIVMGNAENMTYVTTFGSGVNIPLRNYDLGQGVYTYPQIASSPKICSFSYFDFNIMTALENARIVNTGVPENEVNENE